MPQTPTPVTDDPDQMLRKLGGVPTSTPAAPAGDSDQILKQFGGVVLSGPLGTALTTGAQARQKVAEAVDRNVFTPLNPMTPEGRQNLAGTAAAVGMGLATEGMGVLPWIQRILATPAAAALGGMTAEGGEQLAGTKPVSGEAVGAAGLTQGAYEGLGRTVLWPWRWARTRFKAAPAVAEQAAKWVEDNIQTVKEAGTAAVAEQAAKGRSYLTGLRGAPGGTGGGTRQLVADATAASNKQRAEDIANLDVWHRDQIAAARKVYDTLAHAPEGAIKGAREGIAATTRLTAPRGAAQVGLDVAGRKISAAAATGPALPLAPVQAAIEQLLVEAHPGTIFQPAEKSTGLGFLDNLRARRTGEAATGVATSADQIKLTERIAQALGLSPADLATAGIDGRVKELTNLLGRVITTPEKTMSFAEAHQLKSLLDESITWDQRATTAMERITKNARQTLREQMSVHAPYNIATAEYAHQVKLYTEGAGKRLIDAVHTNPDSVVRLLNPKNPAGAQQIKDLLVQQSARGGDPVVGFQAWQDLQSAFVYDHVIKGGPEKLSQRIGQLLSETPEGAKVILGDPTAQRVLSNADRIGQAYLQQVEGIGQQRAVADRQSAQATQATIRTARDIAADKLSTAKALGKEKTAQVSAAAAEQNTAARDLKNEFAASTVARYGHPQMVVNELTDIGVAATHTTSPSAVRSIARLLQGPKTDDLVQWAAHSDQNTKRLVDALHGQLRPAQTAVLLKEMIGYAFGGSNPSAGVAATSPQAQK